MFGDTDFEFLVSGSSGRDFPSGCGAVVWGIWAMVGDEKRGTDFEFLVFRSSDPDFPSGWGVVVDENRGTDFELSFRNK
jgi:hypothetical protein